MVVRSRIDSSGPGSLFVRFLGALFLLVLVIRGGADWVGTAQASDGGHSFQDSDFDGLSNEVEAYLSTVSTDPAFAANPFDADSDGDGQPDGFEYCLSDRAAVVSPGVVHPVVPKITLGSHQEGEYLVLSIYLIPGDVSLVDRFQFLAAAPSVTGQTVLIEATELLVDNIGLMGSASLVRHGPHSMAVYQARTSIALMGAFSSVAFAVLAEVAGEKVGDSATFTIQDGTAYRWNYRPSQSPSGEGGGEGGGGGGSSSADGEGEPQQDAGGEASPGMVCVSTELPEPTGVPGVLVTVPISTGCDFGSWQCDPTACTDGGAASQPKVVLDHLQLLW